MSESTPTPEGQEPESLDFSKQGTITYANRAPHSKDQGRFWVQYSASSAPMSLYVRHPLTGTWTKPT